MQIYLLIGQERQGPFTSDEIKSKLQNGECTPETMAWKQGVEGWQSLRAVLLIPETPKPPIFILIGQERQGPFTPDEIQSKLHNGECTPDTKAWKQGVEGWQPLREVLPIPLPPPLATTPKPEENGVNTFLDFFRAYGGLFQRIKNSPLPQPAQWYDYYPVVFPAAFLAFFFFGLGLIPLLITSRLSGGDKGRISLIAAWPIYMAMFPIIATLLVVLVPLVGLPLIWAKKWFTPSTRYRITGVIGGLVLLIAVSVIFHQGREQLASNNTAASTSYDIQNLSDVEREVKIEQLRAQWIKAEGKELRRLSKERARLEPENAEIQVAALEANIEDEAEQFAWNIFGARYVMGVEAAKYSTEAGSRFGDAERFPLVVYVTRDYLLTFSDLGGSQRRDIVKDLKSFFGRIKGSSTCRMVSNVFLTYGASEFYDVYHVAGFLPPSGVMEFMLPMSSIQATNWATISDDAVDQLFDQHGHFKVYDP